MITKWQAMLLAGIVLMTITLGISESFTTACVFLALALMFIGGIATLVTWKP